MQDKFKKTNRGFTLIELMTVMAIIGILAGAIMVSLSVQKKRAVANKVLTEMAGVMQNIYLCKSDDGTVNNPSNGGAICSIDGSSIANYGQWPDVSELSLGFAFSYEGNPAGGNPWFISVSNDEVGTICCNSKYGKCNKLEGESCDVSTVLK